MEAFKQLATLLAEARSLIDQVPNERNKVAQVNLFMKDLTVGFDQYGNPRLNENLLPWAKLVNSEVKLHVIAKVDEMHRADLERRSHRLEEIRSAIASLAAQAAIELGWEARALLDG